MSDDTKRPTLFAVEDHESSDSSSSSSSDDDSQYKEAEEQYIKGLLETTELPLDNKPYWYDMLPDGKPVQISIDPEVFESEVDVAIIGGGLTGMSCALHALK